MPKSSFVEKNAIFIVIALVAIAGYGMMKAKATIVDDCSKISKVGYQRDMVLPLGNVWGTTNLASYDYARVITGVPSYAYVSESKLVATVTRVTDSANNMYINSAKVAGVSVAKCLYIDYAYVVSSAGEPQFIADPHVEGYYDLSYSVKFGENIVATPTPAVVPSPVPTSLPESTVIVNPYVCQDGTFVSDLSKCKKQDSNSVLALIGLAVAFITGFYILKKRK